MWRDVGKGVLQDLAGDHGSFVPVHLCAFLRRHNLYHHVRDWVVRILNNTALAVHLVIALGHAAIEDLHSIIRVRRDAPSDEHHDQHVFARRRRYDVGGHDSLLRLDGAFVPRSVFLREARSLAFSKARPVGFWPPPAIRRYRPAGLP
jgi:hypothetical protein